MSIICSASLPPKVTSDHIMQPDSALCPDTIEDMTASLSDNNNLGSVTDILTESPLTPPLKVSITLFHKQVRESTDRLCFISYKGANMLWPRWYLVQIVLEDDDIDYTTESY